jgi:hypothetical protein
MHAQKVAGRQGPGLSGEMDPKTRAAAAAAVNALFIFLLSEPPNGKNCCVKNRTRIRSKARFPVEGAQVLNRPRVGRTGADGDRDCRTRSDCVLIASFSRRSGRDC